MVRWVKMVQKSVPWGDGEVVVGPLMDAENADGKEWEAGSRDWPAKGGLGLER